MCKPVLRDYLGGVTPGEVYLFTTNGPSLKSHKRRKRLKAGPVKTEVVIYELFLYVVISSETILAPPPNN